MRLRSLSGDSGCVFPRDFFAQTESMSNRYQFDVDLMSEHRSSIVSASFQHRFNIDSTSIQHRSSIDPASLQHRLLLCVATGDGSTPFQESRAQHASSHGSVQLSEKHTLCSYVALLPWDWDRGRAGKEEGELSHMF